MSNNPIKPKDRVKIPRSGMPEQDPAARARNFNEVNLGLPGDLAHPYPIDPRFETSVASSSSVG